MLRLVVLAFVVACVVSDKVSEIEGNWTLVWYPMKTDFKLCVHGELTRVNTMCKCGTTEGIPNVIIDTDYQHMSFDFPALFTDSAEKAADVADVECTCKNEKGVDIQMLNSNVVLHPLSDNYLAVYLGNGDKKYHPALLARAVPSEAELEKFVKTNLDGETGSAICTTEVQESKEQNTGPNALTSHIFTGFKQRKN